MAYLLLLLRLACSIKLKLNKGQELDIENPSDFPEPTIEEILEPIIDALLFYQRNIWAIYDTLPRAAWRAKRDELILMKSELFLNISSRSMKLPQTFMIELKSFTSGYASLDYEEAGYQACKSGQNGYPAQW